MTYSELAAAFRGGPREIPTAPVNGSIPRWFRVYERRGEVWVASGQEHPNACRISPDRRLKPGELPVMLELYRRRKQGEPVAREAKRQTINQSYWYGVFRALDL